MTTIRCAISPDADDLFMFRGITEALVDTEGLDFRVETADTDALNRMASGDGADVNAISIAWYPKVAAHYQLFDHGGSVGRGYGPALVAAKKLQKLEGLRIGVPGLTTTAHLVMKQVCSFTPVVIPIQPHARVFEALRSGEVEAAVVIHEGRLTWAQEGFELLLDLGQWWNEHTGLPLPLGGNVVRRSLGPETIAQVDRIVHRSIAHGLSHRDDAIRWLLARGGALSTFEQVDRYLQMYANADTLSYGADGRAAIRRLVHLSGHPADVDFVGGHA